MTPMSGRYIGFLIAESIVIARDQACCAWLSGKDSTTPPMPRVGNRLNTLRMHPTLSRHSIRPIQTSRLLESMRRGPCLIFFLIFSPAEPSLSNRFSELLFLFHPLFYSFNSPSTCWTLLHLPTLTSPSSLLPPPIPRQKPPSSPPAA